MKGFVKILAFAGIESGILCGCNSEAVSSQKDDNSIANESTESIEENIIIEENGIKKLNNNLSYGCFKGDYGFDRFISSGGASTDREVVEFLISDMGVNFSGFSLIGDIFGCSTVSVKGDNGGYYFGRNFDWQPCNAMVVTVYPDKGYSSISTVNTDFIFAMGNELLSKDEALLLASVYAPLDGINEKGLCVSVNMIQDNEKADMNTSKPDITTTTAVRLLLDNAADTNEAVNC